MENEISWFILKMNGSKDFVQLILLNLIIIIDWVQEGKFDLLFSYQFQQKDGDLFGSPDSIPPPPQHLECSRCAYLQSFQITIPTSIPVNVITNGENSKIKSCFPCILTQDLQINIKYFLFKTTFNIFYFYILLFIFCFF